MPRLADADIVKADAVGGSFLDLMLEEKRSRRLPLPLVLCKRRKRDAQPVMAERSAEGDEHAVPDPEIAEPEPARIVALEQCNLPIEGTGADTEDVLYAHGCKLLGLLGEELASLRPRARRDRLQVLPVRLNGREIVGDTKRESSEVGIDQDWTTPFDSVSYRLLRPAPRADSERQSFLQESAVKIGASGQNNG
jgi:hypothetical protein